MDKIIVGIVPEFKFKTDDNPYHDRYCSIDLYTKRLSDEGAICIGLIPQNGSIPNEVLDMCDCFLLQGGLKIDHIHYQTINYALKNNKPLLGICLGMQAIGIYSKVAEDNLLMDSKTYYDIYNRLKEENNGSLLKQIENNEMHIHYIDYENKDTAKHIVNVVDKDSILYDIYKEDTLDEVSLHNYALKFIGKDFKVTAKAEDGVIEAIEYSNKDYFIVGLQYHPEWRDDNKMFKRLVEEGMKRKNG